MAPRKVKTKNRPRSKAPGRALAPMPIKSVPRSDPPTITLTTVRSFTLSERLTASAGAVTLDYPTLIDTIYKQVFDGKTDVNMRYILCGVHAWGSPGPGRVSMYDASTLVEVSDIGNYSSRPRVGLYYPPTLQVVSDKSKTGDIVGFNTTEQSDVIDVRMFIRVWSQAINS